MAASSIDEFRRNLRRTQQRVAPLLTSHAAADERRLIGELQMTMEELQVAEEELLMQQEELRRHERDADEQLGRYRGLFDTAPTAYLTTDQSGLVTEANGMAQQLLRREAGRLVGRPLTTLVEVTDRPAFRAAVNRLARRGGVRTWELRIVPRIGGVLDLTASVAAGTDSSGAPELRWVLRTTEPPRARDPLARAVRELSRQPASDGDVTALLSALCECAADVVGAASGGVLLADDQERLSTVVAPDPETHALLQLQLRHVQGPCYEAFARRHGVRVADLSAEVLHWPEVVARARAQDLRAVLAVPMLAGAHTVGALQLSRVGPGPFTDSDLLTAEALAGLAGEVISRGREMDGLSELSRQLRYALDSRVVIEQAKGVLSERTGVSLSSAFAALRSYARGTNRRLHDVCDDLLAGRIGHESLDLGQPDG